MAFKTLPSLSESGPLMISGLRFDLTDVFPACYHILKRHFVTAGSQDYSEFLMSLSFLEFLFMFVRTQVVLAVRTFV